MKKENGWQIKSLGEVVGKTGLMIDGDWVICGDGLGVFSFGILFGFSSFGFKDSDLSSNDPSK